MRRSVLKLKNDRIVQTENDIETKCLHWLGNQGWTAIRCHVGSVVTWDLFWRVVVGLITGEIRRNTDAVKDYIKTRKSGVIGLHEEGTSDWLMIHGKYPAWWFEVKRPGGKPTSKQLKFIEERRLLKQKAVWADGLDHRDRCAQPLMPWYFENIAETVSNERDELPERSEISA